MNAFRTSMACFLAGCFMFPAIDSCGLSLQVIAFAACLLAIVTAKD